VALLQISEPGMSPAPHEQRLAVGIDLGTTNSLVATMRSGTATVLPDALGRPLLPSIVRYAEGGKVEVGFPAQAKQATDPRNTIVSWTCRRWNRDSGSRYSARMRRARASRLSRKRVLWYALGCRTRSLPKDRWCRNHDRVPARKQFATMVP